MLRHGDLAVRCLLFARCFHSRSSTKGLSISPLPQQLQSHSTNIRRPGFISERSPSNSSKNRLLIFSYWWDGRRTIIRNAIRLYASDSSQLHSGKDNELPKNNESKKVQNEKKEYMEMGMRAASSAAGEQHARVVSVAKASKKSPTSSSSPSTFWLPQYKPDDRVGKVRAMYELCLTEDDLKSVPKYMRRSAYTGEAPEEVYRWADVCQKALEVGWCVQLCIFVIFLGSLIFIQCYRAVFKKWISKCSGAR